MLQGLNDNSFEKLKSSPLLNGGGVLSFSHSTDTKYLLCASQQKPLWLFLKKEIVSARRSLTSLICPNLRELCVSSLPLKPLSSAQTLDAWGLTATI